MEKIFATEERRNVLVANGINFAVDVDFCFVFPSLSDYNKAVKAFKKALVF